MSLSTSFRIVVRAASQFSEDGGPQMGAALAYYALFSTAPLLLLAVMVAGLFFGEEAAQTQVRDQLTRIVNADSADLIIGWMRNASRPASSWLAAAVGILLMVVGALSLFLHLRHCLSIIWRLEPPVRSSFLMTVVNYLLAILAVLLVGVLLLASLAASAAVGVLVQYLGNRLPGGGVLWHWVDIGVSFLLLSLFFALLYRVMSAGQLPWGYIWYGAFLSSFLFVLGKTLIGLYLAYTSTTVYGAAGSLVVFLIWVYYSSQIAFFGAELIQARRTRQQWLAR